MRDAVPTGAFNPAAIRVSVRVAAMLLDYLRGNGLDPARLYPREHVAAIDGGRIGLQIPLDDWLGMMQKAIRATGDADLPLKAGASMKPRHLGVLGYVYMSCATLEEASQQSARYLRLVHGMGDSQLRISGSAVEIPLPWPGAEGPPPALAQFRLASRASMARWLTGRFELPMDACFQFAPPERLAAYEAVFGGRLQFGADETKLVHPAQYMQLPILMADREMQRVTRAEAEALLRQIAGEPDFLRELKTTLAQGLALGRGSLVHAAQALHISTRTLHRRLEQHGSSFQKVLAEVRQHLAERYLSDSGASLNDVAFLLGYTEQSSFQRAFKRWSGQTPGEFRARRATAPP